MCAHGARVSALHLWLGMHCGPPRLAGREESRHTAQRSAALGGEAARAARQWRAAAGTCIDMYMLIEAWVKSLWKNPALTLAVGEIAKRILSHPVMAVLRIFFPYVFSRLLFSYWSVGIFLFASMRPFVH